jgi:quercetin dioxygenase-like cupin family protein
MRTSPSRDRRATRCADEEQQEAAVADIDRKSFDAADEEFPLGQKARGERVTLDGLSVLRATFEPGWHWTEHVSTDLCTRRHAGYVISGRLHVVTNDGGEAQLEPGDVVTIEPGHDAWTVGDEPCVFVDFAESIRQ